MTNESMLAAVYRGINDVRVERLPIPTIGPGEALVRIASCGVCGTDLKKIEFGLTPPPRIFGHEMAGTIAQIGSAVTDWQVGDRVAVTHHVPCMYCHYCRQRSFAQCATYKRTGTTAGFEPAGGGFAEYVRVMDWVLARGTVRIPDDVTFEEASFIEPVNTCLKGVCKAQVGPDQTVLVIGQGQIGLIFTQLCVLRGATVIGVDRLPARLTAAIRFGASVAFSPDMDDIAEAVRTRTEGRGADLAIVAVADTGTIATAFESVRPGGKVLLFAQTRLDDPVQIDAGAICMLEKDLIGSYSSDTSLQDEAADLVFGHALNVRDLITHRFPLREIDCAIQMAQSPREGSLKIMVEP